MIRTFEKEVKLTTRAEYQQRGETLYLQRWRLIVDGEAPGEWRLPSNKDNGGWERRVPITKLADQ